MYALPRCLSNKRPHMTDEVTPQDGPRDRTGRGAPRLGLEFLDRLFGLTPTMSDHQRLPRSTSHP